MGVHKEQVCRVLVMSVHDEERVWVGEISCGLAEVLVVLRCWDDECEYCMAGERDEMKLEESRVDQES